MQDFLGTILGQQVLAPTIVSFLVSVLVLFLFRAFEMKRSAEIDYKFEQKRKIKSAIGSNLRPTLIKSERLFARFENLSKNYSEKWLLKSKPISSSGYYFKSTVIRFMEFYVSVFDAEKAYISLDARYADAEDYEFQNFMKVFHWVLFDIDQLFQGFLINHTQPVDHFFADQIRSLSIRFRKIVDLDHESEEIQAFFDDKRNGEIMDFFSGLSPKTEKRRWDRIVALSLLLAGFQDAFGGKRLQYSDEQLSKIADRFVDAKMCRNLLNVLLNHQLVSSRTGLKLAAGLEKSFKRRTGSIL